MSDSDSNETKPPQWLVVLAWRVYDLVRLPKNMSRFQEMVRRWDREYRIQLAKYEEWERLRREHEDRVRTDPQLRDKSAGRPEPGWNWDCTPIRIYRYRQSRQGKEAMELWFEAPNGAWTPPDLFYDREPEPESLFPLPDRELTLAEKYVVLAAIHDHFCPRREPIDPWRNEQDAWEPSPKQLIMPGMPYIRLMDDAKQSPEDDEDDLFSILKDVRFDLSDKQRSTADDPEVPTKATSGYTVAALRELTGLGNTALNRYAKLTGVATPGRGGKNFRYSAANARAILETIIANTSEDTLLEKCRAELANLKEIA